MRDASTEPLMVQGKDDAKESGKQEEKPFQDEREKDFETQEG